MYSFLLYIFVGLDITFVSLWIYIFTSNSNEIVHVSINKYWSSTKCFSPYRLTDTAGDTSDTMHTVIIFDNFREKSSTVKPIYKALAFQNCLAHATTEDGTVNPGVSWYTVESLLVCSSSHVLNISSLKFL